MKRSALKSGRIVVEEFSFSKPMSDRLVATAEAYRTILARIPVELSVGHDYDKLKRVGHSKKRVLSDILGANRLVE